VKFLEIGLHGFAADSGDELALDIDGEVGKIGFSVLEGAELFGCVEEALENREASLGMRLAPFAAFGVPLRKISICAEKENERCWGKRTTSREPIPIRAMER
jgi:hypothetical protein